MTAIRKRGARKKGKDMLKTFTKLKVAGVASVLGVALAASGAYAATGALTSRDAPGQVLKVSGVGPASDHASATAIAHANPKARGLFGGTDAKAKAHVNATAIAHANTRAPFRAATMPMAAVGQQCHSRRGTSPTDSARLSRAYSASRSPAGDASRYGHAIEPNEVRAQATTDSPRTRWLRRAPANS
jgi:hypothetical protein